MSRIDTLTAYNCRFSYLQRNNPMLEEQRKLIQKGETPNISLSDFIKLYSEYITTLTIGKNTDRAIMMEKDRVESFNFEKSECWHIIPISGKQGAPVTVVKTTNKKRYDFGPDTAALYNHHIFCYTDGKHIVMVFHRQSGSGCKSIFLETANKLLKEKGIKLEMELVFPLEEEFASAEPLKITLQYTENIISSDIAENISGPRRKGKVIRDLGLNLESAENASVKGLIEDFKLKKIPKDVAFAKIIAEVNDGTDYDTAEICLKIGGHKRTCSWNEIEKLYGIHDISNELQALYKSNGDFKSSLRQLANEYYCSIVSSGVLKNE